MLQAIYGAANRLDGAATLLALGARAAIAAFAAIATPAAAPTPTALAVAILAVAALTLVARGWTAFAAGLRAAGLAATVVAIAATAATATVTAASAATTAAVMALAAVAPRAAVGAGGRSGCGRLVAPEEALEPAEEAAGFLLGFRLRGALGLRRRVPRLETPVVAPRFTRGAGFKIARPTSVWVTSRACSALPSATDW